MTCGNPVAAKSNGGLAEPLDLSTLPHMLQRLPFRLALLVFVAAGALAAGCTPTGATRYPDSRYPDSRRPDARYPDRYPDSRRYPDARRTSPAVYARVTSDADRYVRSLDRRLRLDRRQERLIRDLLADRAYDRVARRSRRDAERYYPFPRRAEDRRNRDWWRSTDRKIERVLDRRQRRIYRDMLQDRERAHRARGHKNQKGRGHQNKRGRGHND